MSSIVQTATPVALEALRQPIRAFAPRRPSEENFKVSMLGLADLLEELWDQEEGDTLESTVVWTALHAFPGLIMPGPKPQQLVDLAVGGDLMDAESADLLRSVHKILRILQDFEPPGFAAALWRAVLIAMYGMIELFVVVDDDGSTDRCFELLDAAEAMADKFAGRA